MMSLGDPNYYDDNQSSTYAASGFDAFIQANPISSSISGAIGALSAATQFIKDLAHQLETAFGIGVGRNEANLITPYQNQLGAPGGILNTAQILSQDPSHNNPTDLNQIYQITLQAVNTFYKYIGYPDYPKSQWPDGRASKQAYASISAVAPGILADIKARLIAAGGVLIPIRNLAPAGSIGAQLRNDLAQLQGDGSGPIGSGGGSGARLPTGTTSLVLIGVVVLVLVLSQGSRSS